MTIHGARCLVKLAPPQARASGILEAPALKAAPCLGKVVQAGPECTEVQPGDVVLIAPEAPVESMGALFPTPHVMVHEANILGICERTA